MVGFPTGQESPILHCAVCISSSLQRYNDTSSGQWFVRCIELLSSFPGILYNGVLQEMICDASTDPPPFFLLAMGSSRRRPSQRRLGRERENKFPQPSPTSSLYDFCVAVSINTGTVHARQPVGLEGWLRTSIVLGTSVTYSGHVSNELEIGQRKTV